MAPKRKSDQVDLDLTGTYSMDENNQAVAPTKKPRKLDASNVDPSSSTSDKNGKEKSTKPQSWQDVKLDGEDEVKNIMARFSPQGHWQFVFSCLQGSIPV